jgi:ABC-type sugar transport system ATPase subunit/ribose/xylose/arabinose/galactoside ABC-type transport system permease subunit
VVDAPDQGLVVTGVTKVFGPTVALDGMTARFAPGRVHGLIGENGSGKSTLVKIVTGVHRADAGTLSYAGVDLTGGTQLGSTDRIRVACVYQDGSLIEELTVAQNLDLMVRPDERAAYAGSGDWQRDLLDAFDLPEIDHRRLVGDLPANQARLVEIAGTLARRPDIVLFDESTSTLDAAGVEHVLRLMRATAERGACVVFVTHRLKEVLSVADDLVVLRDGVLVTEVAAAGVSEAALIEAMAGRRVATFTRRTARAGIGAEPVLSTVGVVTDRCGPIDMVVLPGEIVGIGGAAGNGQAELVRGMVGSGLGAGSVRVGGAAVRSTTEGVRAGILFVSSDRRAESLSSQLSIRENFTLGAISGAASWWQWLRRGPEVARARALAARFGLVHSSIEQPADSMSGGNQQKLAIGRAIARRPKVLVVEEPTEGVDARSRFDIYRALTAFAEQGAAVIVASSDATELRHLADRVTVLARGRVVAEVAGEDVTEQAIVQAFSTAVQQEERSLDEPTDGEPVQADAVLARPGRRRAPRGAARPWEPAKLGLLAVFMLALGAYAATVDIRFLSLPNIAAICLFALPVALVALAELPVMIAGQIDASLGSAMGLTVVAVSFLPTMPVPLLVLVAITIGVLMGAVNAVLVVALRINAVIATIATLGVFYGVAALLRPTPAGSISLDLTTGLRAGLLGIPGAFLAVVVIAVVVDVLVYRTRRGLSTRAVGYSLVRSANLGVRARSVQATAFVVAGALAGVGGLVLAARTGVGDPSVGASYTLLAIAVPVLGGTLLSGGHGSAVGCILGALFVAEVQILVPFINLPNGGFLVCVGVLTILALVVGSRDRPAAVAVAA